jgi:hypothetical protein
VNDPSKLARQIKKIWNLARGGRKDAKLLLEKSLTQIKTMPRSRKTNRDRAKQQQRPIPEDEALTA